MWKKFHKGGNALLLAAVALASGLVNAPAMAQTDLRKQTTRASYLNGFGPAKPPIGFVDFCARYPAECRPVGPARERIIRLTPQRWELLKQVNTYINRTVKAMTDDEIYGHPEVWEYPKNGRGDCEDYVLEKKRYLEALGLPAEALMIAVVLDEKGGGHAVLLVRTDRGDLALDNRRERILPWNRTGYTYLMRQSQRHPARWVALTRKPIASTRIFGRNR